MANPISDPVLDLAIDLVLDNATVITVDPDRPRAGSVAISAGRIVGYARSPATRARAAELGFCDDVTDTAAAAAPNWNCSWAVSVLPAPRST